MRACAYACEREIYYCMKRGLRQSVDEVARIKIKLLNCLFCKKLTINGRLLYKKARSKLMIVSGRVSAGGNKGA